LPSEKLIFSRHWLQISFLAKEASASEIAGVAGVSSGVGTGFFGETADCQLGFWLHELWKTTNPPGGFASPKGAHKL
jgi:hypothetical protein